MCVYIYIYIYTYKHIQYGVPTELVGNSVDDQSCELAKRAVYSSPLTPSKSNSWNPHDVLPCEIS